MATVGEDIKFFRIDGGYAWIVVIASFIGSAISLGSAYSIGGTFLVSWLDELGSPHASLAPSVSLVYFITFGGGVVWSAAIRCLGFRSASLLGTTMSVAGWLLMPFAKELGDGSIYVLFSIPFACGAGLTFFSSTTVITLWFAKRRGLAQGLGAAGSGTGVVVVTQILNALIENYGWTSAARIFAVIYGCVGLGASLCFLQPPNDTAPDPGPSQTSGPAGQHGGNSNRYVQLLKDPVMMILAASGLINCIGFTMPYLFLADHVRSEGHSADFAALMVSILGFASIVGRVVFPWIVDFGFHPVAVFGAAALMLGLACSALWPFCSSRETFIAFSVVEGVALGAPVPLSALVAAKLFGLSRFRDALGVQFFFVGFGMLLSGPVGGLIYDATSSYGHTAVVGGGAQLLSAFILQLVWFYRRPDAATQQESSAKTSEKMAEEEQSPGIGKCESS